MLRVWGFWMLQACTVVVGDRGFILVAMGQGVRYGGAGILQFLHWSEQEGLVPVPCGVPL